MTKREVSIELGKLVMRLFAEGARQEDVITALREKTDEERRIHESAQHAARSY